MAKPPKNHGQPWTKQDIQELKKLIKGNTPTDLLAHKLGRTSPSVRAKVHELGLSLAPTNKSPYG